MKDLAPPKACIELNPTKQSVVLGGVYINQSAIARSQNMDQSYLSRIFAGKRVPTINSARKIAAALGMGLEQFLEALDERKAQLKEQHDRELAAYNDRIQAEDASDKAKLRKGLPVAPRMPALRAS